MPATGITVTPKLAAVLMVFLADPDREQYGLGLMRLTGQPSGTLYPLLAKLEQAGWIVARREDIDPRGLQRPARTYYRITPEAAAMARSRLQALSDRYRPPAGS